MINRITRSTAKNKDIRAVMDVRSPRRPRSAYLQSLVIPSLFLRWINIILALQERPHESYSIQWS